MSQKGYWSGTPDYYGDPNWMSKWNSWWDQNYGPANSEPPSGGGFSPSGGGGWGTQSGNWNAPDLLADILQQIMNKERDTSSSTNQSANEGPNETNIEDPSKETAGDINPPAAESDIPTPPATNLPGAPPVTSPSSIPGPTGGGAGSGLLNTINGWMGLGNQALSLIGGIRSLFTPSVAGQQKLDATAYQQQMEKLIREIQAAMDKDDGSQLGIKIKQLQALQIQGAQTGAMNAANMQLNAMANQVIANAQSKLGWYRANNANFKDRLIDDPQYNASAVKNLGRNMYLGTEQGKDFARNNPDAPLTKAFNQPNTQQRFDSAMGMMKQLNGGEEVNKPQKDFGPQFAELGAKLSDQLSKFQRRV